MSFHPSSIYSFTEPCEYLNAYFSYRQEKSSSFSLRKWAYKMEFNNLLTLKNILSGRQKIKSSYIERFQKGLDIDPSEFLYFEMMVRYKNAKTQNEKNAFYHLLNELSPGEEYKCEFATELKEGALWLQISLISIFKLKNIGHSLNDLFNLFDGKVSQKLISKELKSLSESNMIKLNEGTGRYQLLCPSISTKNDVPHPGAKDYYKQMNSYANEAIDFPLTEREFQYCSLAINKEDIPLAKTIIRDFRKKLASLDKSSADCIYQMNLQFFPFIEPNTQSLNERPVQ